MRLRPAILICALFAAGALCCWPTELNAQDGGETAESEDDSPETDESAGWQETFNGEALDLADKEARYLVVTAKGRPAAADALRRGLTDSGAKMVMDGRDVADMTGMSDEAILAKTDKLPVDRVVIVRVIRQGDAPMAIVTTYDADGEPIAGYTATRGQKIDDERLSSAPSGLTDRAVSATTETVESEMEGGGDEAEDDSSSDDRADEGRYDANNFTDGWTLRDRQTDKSYEGVDIYETLGADDLAEEYRQNVAGRKRMKGIGLAASIVGASAVGLGSYFIYRSRRPLLEDAAPTSGPCASLSNERVQHNCRVEQRRQDLQPLGTAGIATAGVGVAAAVTGLIMLPEGNPHPISFGQLVERVDTANDRAEQTDQETSKKDGRLEDADATSNQMSAPADIHIYPTVDPTRGSGGLQLQIQF